MIRTTTAVTTTGYRPAGREITYFIVRRLCEETLSLVSLSAVWYSSTHHRRQWRLRDILSRRAVVYLFIVVLTLVRLANAVTLEPSLNKVHTTFPYLCIGTGNQKIRKKLVDGVSDFPPTAIAHQLCFSFSERCRTAIVRLFSWTHTPTRLPPLENVPKT